VARATAIVVAGPGIVPAGVGAVRAFSRATGVGVLNTYGVKGLFRWDDPSHYGTIGLQARDLELAGILDADVVIAVGLDDRELAASALGPRAAIVVPDELEQWRDRVRPTPRGPLFDRLRTALAAPYASERVPLNPAAAVADIAALLPPSGIVCAEPGLAGLWVARALPTLELGSVFVPPTASDGAAARHAAAAAAEGRGALYVTDHLPRAEPPPGVVVEVWQPHGTQRTRQERRRTLAGALASRTACVLATAVDLDETQLLVDVAGPVTAWTQG